MRRLLTLLASLLLLPVLAHAATCNVVEDGAIGDGKTINTVAIQKAIDRCQEAGGGRVVIPGGVFISGTLRLHSNIDLHLEAGAVLKGSSRLADYLYGGRRLGLLYTENAENVSISGTGTIDGNGDTFMVLNQAKKMPSEATANTLQQDRFREVKQGLGDGPLVPQDRPFQTIIFTNSRNVTVRDVLIRNSPFWTVHFHDCDGVVIHGIRLWNSLMVPNSDGLDFTSCNNVLVSDSDIRAGDDAIVFGGYSWHFDLPGFTGQRHISENFTVTNCTLQSRSSAIRIGGADQNTIRNGTFTNLVISDSNRGIGVFAREQGSIEDMTFSNIVIKTRLHTGDWWGNGEPIHLSAVRNMRSDTMGQIRNIKFTDIVAEGESGILVYGTPESIIEGVSFTNVSLHVKESPLAASSGGNLDLRPVLDPKLQLFRHDIPAIFAQHVKDLRFRDVDVSWGAIKETFYTRALEVTDFQGVVIDNFRGTSAPLQSNRAAILLQNGKDQSVRESTNPGSTAPVVELRNVE